jgi:hypothetical protein
MKAASAIAIASRTSVVLGFMTLINQPTVRREAPSRRCFLEGSSGDVLFRRRQANLIASKGMLFPGTKN